LPYVSAFGRLGKQPDLNPHLTIKVLFLGGLFVWPAIQQRLWATVGCGCGDDSGMVWGYSGIPSGFLAVSEMSSGQGAALRAWDAKQGNKLLSCRAKELLWAESCANAKEKPLPGGRGC